MVDRFEPDRQIPAARPEVTPVISPQLFENILAALGSNNKLVTMSLIAPGEQFTRTELTYALMNAQLDDGWDIPPAGVHRILRTLREIGAVVSVDVRKAPSADGVMLKHRKPFAPEGERGEIVAYEPIQPGEPVGRTLFSLTPIGEQFRWIAGSLGNFYVQNHDFYKQREIDLAQYLGSIHTANKALPVTTAEGRFSFVQRHPAKRLALLQLLTSGAPGTKLNMEYVQEQLQETEDSLYYLVGSMVNAQLLCESRSYRSRIYGLKQGFDPAVCLEYLNSEYFGRRRKDSQVIVPETFSALDQLALQLRNEARCGWPKIKRLIETAMQAGGAFTWQEYVNVYYEMNPETKRTPEAIEAIRGALYRLSQDTGIGILESVPSDGSFLWLDPEQSAVHTEYVRLAQAIQAQDPEEVQRGYEFIGRLRSDRELVTSLMRDARESSRHVNFVSDETIAGEVLAILQAASQPMDAYAIVEAIKARSASTILPKDLVLARKVREVMKAEEGRVIIHFNPHEKPQYRFSLNPGYHPDEP